MSDNAFIVRCAPSKISQVKLVLENNQIVIGWSETKNLLFRDKLSKDDFKRILLETHEHLYLNDSRRLGHAAGNLWRFVREIKIGDYVLVPIPKAFYLCKVTGDVRCIPEGKETDTVIRRDVEWLNNKEPIPRDTCDVDLLSKLSIRRACLEIGMVNNIETALETCQKESQ